MIHKTLKKSFWALLLILSLAACGNGNSGKESGAQQGGAIQTPNVGNLPAPSAQGGANPSEDSAEGPNTIFFQRKDLWDSFSSELKDQIQSNYSKSGSMTGAGDGGHGYYNTLFGRTSPNFGSSGSSSSTPPVVSAQSISGPTMQTLQLRSMPMALTSAPACNAASTFLCLDRPADKEGTVVDSILVQGAINMDEAALFTPTDPVVLISVFRQSGEAVNEYALKASDLTSIPKTNPDDPQTASFSKTVGLAGPGGYTIVVSAFKNVGDSVLLESIAVSVTREDVPQIELVKLEPPPEGNLYPTDPAQRHKPVNSGDTVSMASVKVTVRLKSPGTNHVGILFQNFDEGGNLRYISNGDSGFGSEDQPDGTTLPTKSADLVLFQGLNHITITAHNDLLDELGLSPDQPSTLDVNLTNVVPLVKVKITSPKDGSIVEATDSDQKVDVNFCLTDLTALPGRPSPAGAGECISNWNGEKPTVIFNGYSFPSSSISKDGSGNYSTQVKPVLGGNLVQVSVTDTHFLPPPDSSTPAVSLGNAQASFAFGKVEKLFSSGGTLNETTNSFLSRGLALEINKKLITSDVKTMVLKFLNDADFKKTFIDLFKKTSPGITNVCTEVDGYSVDTGDSSIDLLPDTVHLGDFEILQLEPHNDNKLHVIARLNGFTGEANIRGLNATVQVQEDGVDLSFIPITIGIKQMTIAVDLTFNKKNGISQMDLLKDADHEIVDVVGTDAMGRFVWINSSRNPLAAGLEQIYGPGDVLGDTFLKSLKRNFVCGLENSLNNNTTGLGHWEDDIQKLVSYNNLNPFRIPLEFDLLNKLIGMDIAYDVLRGDITFNDRGVQVHNVPLRIGPSPRVLNHLVDLLSGSIAESDQTASDKQILASPSKNLIGSLSAPASSNETPPVDSSSTEVHNVGLELPEDALNQALSAASLAGLLDLEIDPNFWTNNNITFIDKATPTVQDMIGAKVDLNQNGIEDDDRLPVQLKLTTDKTLPPVLHFLSQSEINALADRTNCFLNQPTGGSGSSSPQNCDPSTFTQRLNPDLKYFRLTLSNVDLAIYRVYPVGREVGGVKTYCSKADPVGEPDSLYATRPKLPPFKLTGNSSADAANKACRQTVTPLNETTDDTCPEGYNKLVIPLKNGPVISAVPVAPGTPEVPVVRYKGDLVIQGVMEGIFREILFSDQNKDPNAGPVNFLRVKFMPTDFGPESLYLKLKVVENHTGLSEAALTNQLSNVLIPGALGTNCETLNELQIPIPDRFPSATAQSVGGLIETLHNFGVDHLDFGTSNDDLPQVFVDDNHLYVDLLAHIGVCYQGDACVNPPKLIQAGLSANLFQKIPLKVIDWTKH